MSDKLATGASYATNAATALGGTLTLIGGLSLNEWLAISGIILGFATFIINWLYKHRHYKLATEKDKDK